jgi:stage V sporulation protein G
VNVTEVKVKLMEHRTDRLRAFCSITIDDEFVVRDLRIIEGAKGLFVAMPSRKLTDKCPRCGGKNRLRAAYCDQCGSQLDESRAVSGPRARKKFHVDIAHPINSECRQKVQEKVVEAFEAELERSKEPGYRPLSFEDDEDDYEFQESEETGPEEAPEPIREERPEPLDEEEEEEEEDVEEAEEEEPQDEDEEREFGDGIF